MPTRIRILSLCASALLSVLFLGAADGEEPRHFRKHREFLGWTHDGRYAVWYDPIFNPHEQVVNDPQKGAEDVGDDCAIHLAWVLDTRRGSLTQYLIDASVAKPVVGYYGESPERWPMKTAIDCAYPEEGESMDRTPWAVAHRAQYPKILEQYRKQYARVPGPAALRALMQGRPLTSLPSRTSPDRTLRFELELTSKRPLPQKWDGGTLKVGRGSLADEPVIYDAVARFVIKRGDQMTASIYVPIDDNRINLSLWNGFTPIWAPDGRHVALVLTSSFNIKRDTVQSSTAIMPTLGPKIALESASAELARARELFGDALHAAGHSLLSSEAVPRNQLTARTRVMWVDGYEAAARSIAAVLPGGADVAKQSAHTSYQITIKVGSGIALPPPAK